MGQRAAICGLFVIVGLLGSAFLATAGAAPNQPTYGATAVRVRGDGLIGTRKSVTGFKFDVRRDANGILKGAVVVHCAGTPRRNYASTSISSLTVTDNVATFTATGKLSGAPNRNKVFTADIVATDSSPDSISIVVHNGAAPPACIADGVIARGKIAVPFVK